jgi:excinuclease ABC subunit A
LIRSWSWPIPLSLPEGAISAWPRRFSGYYLQMLCAVLDHYGVERNVPFKDIPAHVQEVLLYGSGKEKIAMEFQMARRKHSRNQPFEGVIPNLARRFHETSSYRVRYDMEKYMSIRPCSLCQGARLKSHQPGGSRGRRNPFMS